MSRIDPVHLRWRPVRTDSFRTASQGFLVSLAAIRSLMVKFNFSAVKRRPGLEVTEVAATLL